MPTYEYKCEDGHRYTEQRSFSQEQTRDDCPECGKSLKTVYSAPMFTLVGRGFYSNGG